MFRVGDRVRYIRDGMNIYGRDGTICAVRYNGFNISHFGIRLDRSFGGHSCNHMCTMGHGFWARPTSIMLLDNHVKIR